jgi:hypothetical protein
LPSEPPSLEYRVVAPIDPRQRRYRRIVLAASVLCLAQNPWMWLATNALAGKPIRLDTIPEHALITLAISMAVCHVGSVVGVIAMPPSRDPDGTPLAMPTAFVLGVPPLLASLFSSIAGYWALVCMRGWNIG